MTAPAWIDSVVREFGRGAGLRDFALNGRGAAAVRFENGRSLRLEWAEATDELVVSVTVAMDCDASAAKRILACSHPCARYGAKVRSGYLARRGCAVFAVRLAAQDATLPALNNAFAVLWRVAAEAGGGAE